MPNNAALIVAGDITMAELRPLAEKAFGAWQRGTPARPALTAPANVASKVVIVDRPGAPQTQLRVAMIGAARSAPDFRPAQVMNTALGGLFSSRINMNLREKNGYTYGASSQFVVPQGGRSVPGGQRRADRRHRRGGGGDDQGTAGHGRSGDARR